MSEVLLLSPLHRGQNRYGCVKCLAKGYYSSKQWSWNLNLGSGILDPSFFIARSIYLFQKRNVVFSISSNLLDCEKSPLSSFRSISWSLCFKCYALKNIYFTNGGSEKFRGLPKVR